VLGFNTGSLIADWSTKNIQMFYLIKFYTNQPTILQILGKLIKNFDIQLVLTIPFSLRFNLSEIILAFLCIVDIFSCFSL
jgi:hypothetical protein